MVLKLCFKCHQWLKLPDAKGDRSLGDNPQNFPHSQQLVGISKPNVNQPEWLPKPLQTLLSSSYGKRNRRLKVLLIAQDKLSCPYMSNRPYEQMSLYARLNRKPLSNRSMLYLVCAVVFQRVSCAPEPQEHSLSTGTATFLGPGRLHLGSREGGCWGFHWPGMGGGFTSPHGHVLPFLSPPWPTNKTAQELRLVAALRYLFGDCRWAVLRWYLISDR